MTYFIVTKGGYLDKMRKAKPPKFDWKHFDPEKFQQWQAKLAAWELTHFRKLRKPLYHGTSCRKISQIRIEGLKINNGSTPWAEEDWIETDEPKLTDRGVYLTEDFETAGYFASQRSFDSDDLCIVQINCVSQNTRIGSDGWGEKMTDNDIPAICLDFFYPKDIILKLNLPSVKTIDDLFKYLEKTR